MILPVRINLKIPLFVAFLAIWVAKSSFSSEFPSRPVKLIVPFSPGGGSDTAGRLLKRAVEANGAFSQPIVIVNVPGGGGTVGSRRVKNAAPDGHTLLLLHEGMFTARHSGQATYGSEAFEPVAGFGRAGTILAVASEAPWKNLQELVADCRSRPETITFACNLGAPAHFIGLQIEKAAGDIQFRFVPSGGGAKRYGDLIGGEVMVTIFSIPEFKAFSGGGIRPLAFLGSERHPSFENIPTAKEQGVPLEASNLQFIWAPANTPQPAIRAIANSVENALSQPAVSAEFENLGIDPIFLKGEALAAEIAAREADTASVATKSPEIFPWFPYYVGGLCGLLVLGLALGEKTQSDPPPVANEISRTRCAGFAALSFAYILALAVGTPFTATTILFTLAFACLSIGFQNIRARQLPWVFTLSLALGFGCQFVFGTILSIDLP